MSDNIPSNMKYTSKRTSSQYSDFNMSGIKHSTVLTYSFIFSAMVKTGFKSVGLFSFLYITKYKDTK